MNKLNASVYPLIGLSVVLSLSAVVAVAARWPDTSTTMVMPVASHHAAMVHNVKVVMHDPGCHWFQTAGGGYSRSMSVKGPVMLTNMDEAALKIAGASGTKRTAVGAGIRLGPGTYGITMVGQAPDDNHLSLRVS
jgi:hypothetical protein